MWSERLKISFEKKKDAETAVKECKDVLTLNVKSVFSSYFKDHSNYCIGFVGDNKINKINLNLNKGTLWSSALNWWLEYRYERD